MSGTSRLSPNPLPRKRARHASPILILDSDDIPEEQSNEDAAMSDAHEENSGQDSDIETIPPTRASTASAQSAIIDLTVDSDSGEDRASPIKEDPNDHDSDDELDFDAFEIDSDPEGDATLGDGWGCLEEIDGEDGSDSEDEGLSQPQDSEHLITIPHDEDLYAALPQASVQNQEYLKPIIQHYSDNDIHMPSDDIERAVEILGSAKRTLADFRANPLLALQAIPRPAFLTVWTSPAVYLRYLDLSHLRRPSGEVVALTPAQVNEALEKVLNHPLIREKLHRWNVEAKLDAIKSLLLALYLGQVRARGGTRYRNGAPPKKPESCKTFLDVVRYVFWAMFGVDVELYPFATGDSVHPIDNIRLIDTIEVSSIVVSGLPNLINIHAAATATRYNIPKLIRKNSVAWPPKLHKRIYLLVFKCQRRVSWDLEQAIHAAKGCLPRKAVFRVLLLTGTPAQMSRQVIDEREVFESADVIELVGRSAVTAVETASIFEDSVLGINPGAMKQRHIRVDNESRAKWVVGNFHQHYAEVQGWMSVDCRRLMLTWYHIVALGAAILAALDQGLDEPIFQHVDKLRTTIAALRFPLYQHVVHRRLQLDETSSHEVFFPRTYPVQLKSSTREYILCPRILDFSVFLPLTGPHGQRYRFNGEVINIKGRYGIRVNTTMLWFELVSSSGIIVAAVPFWRAAAKHELWVLLHVAGDLRLLETRDINRSCALLRFNSYDLQQWMNASDDEIRTLHTEIEKAIVPLRQLQPSTVVGALRNPLDWSTTPFFTRIDRHGRPRPRYFRILAGKQIHVALGKDGLTFSWSFGAEMYAVPHGEQEGEQEDVFFEDKDEDEEGDLSLDFHDFEGRYGRCLVLREKPTKGGMKGDMVARMPLGVAWDLPWGRFLLLIAVGHRFITLDDVKASSLNTKSRQFARLTQFSIDKRLAELHQPSLGGRRLPKQ